MASSERLFLSLMPHSALSVRSSNLGFEPVGRGRRAVSMADIAERTNRTRQSVVHARSGQRGPETFLIQSLQREKPTLALGGCASWFEKQNGRGSHVRGPDSDDRFITRARQPCARS